MGWTRKKRISSRNCWWMWKSLASETNWCICSIDVPYLSLLSIISSHHMEWPGAGSQKDRDTFSWTHMTIDANINKFSDATMTAKSIHMSVCEYVSDKWKCRSYKLPVTAECRLSGVSNYTKTNVSFEQRAQFQNFFLIFTYQ